TGNSFINDDLKAKFHHSNYRKVKVIGFYKGFEPFPQPQGTLERLTSHSTKSWRFVDNFYQTILKNQKMNNVSTILKYKNQIILQGPPGTGKTRLAKEIALELTALEIKNIIDEKHLTSFLVPGTVIQTPTKYNTFSIVRLD